MWIEHASRRANRAAKRQRKTKGNRRECEAKSGTSVSTSSLGAYPIEVRRANDIGLYARMRVSTSQLQSHDGGLVRSSPTYRPLSTDALCAKKCEECDRQKSREDGHWGMKGRTKRAKMREEAKDLFGKAVPCLLNRNQIRHPLLLALNSRSACIRQRRLYPTK